MHVLLSDPGTLPTILPKVGPGVGWYFGFNHSLPRSSVEHQMRYIMAHSRDSRPALVRYFLVSLLLKDGRVAKE